MYSNQDPVLSSSSSGMVIKHSSRTVSPHEVIFQMDHRNGMAKYVSNNTTQQCISDNGHFPKQGNYVS